MKFHGNPSSGSRTDTCVQTDRRTDMKLTDGFLDCAHEPQKLL